MTDTDRTIRVEQTAHTLGHANCLARYRQLMDPSGADVTRNASRTAC